MPWKTLWNSWLELVNHALPFDFRTLEVDEKADGEAGSAQIVKALSSVVRDEALDAFQFKYDAIFDQNIGKIFTDVVPLVRYLEGGLTGRFDAAKGEFSAKRALIDLLQKAGSESIGDLEYGANHSLR
jgi:hypothetical protein